MNRRTAIASMIVIGSGACFMFFTDKKHLKQKAMYKHYGLTIEAAISDGYFEIIKDAQTASYENILFDQVVIAGYYININDIEK